MYSDGVLAEMWFVSSCEKLGLIDKNPPSFLAIKKTLNKHLSYKVSQAIPYMKDRRDPKDWLDRIFKTDCLLLLEDINGQSWRVAVDVTANVDEAEEKFIDINLPSFRRARRELKIDRHWVAVVKPLEISSTNSLIDALYSQIDKSDECAIVAIE